MTLKNSLHVGSLHEHCDGGGVGFDCRILCCAGAASILPVESSSQRMEAQRGGVMLTRLPVNTQPGSEVLSVLFKASLPESSALKGKLRERKSKETPPPCWGATVISMQAEIWASAFTCLRQKKLHVCFGAHGDIFLH